MAAIPTGLFGVVPVLNPGLAAINQKGKYNPSCTDSRKDGPSGFGRWVFNQSLKKSKSDATRTN